MVALGSLFLGTVGLRFCVGQHSIFCYHTGQWALDYQTQVWESFPVEELGGTDLTDRVGQQPQAVYHLGRALRAGEVWGQFFSVVSVTAIQVESFYPYVFFGDRWAPVRSGVFVSIIMISKKSKDHLFITYTYLLILGLTSKTHTRN